MELLFSIFFFKIFKRAGLLLPELSKEPALSEMNYVSDRDLLQLTLEEVYGIFHIDSMSLWSEKSFEVFLAILLK